MHPHQPVKKKKAGNPLLGALGLLVVVALCGVGGVIAFGGDDESSPAPTTVKNVPQYRVVSQKGGNITVEVDTLPTKKQMTAIVTDLQSKQTDEDGYFVSINCSTGATKSADNRLGNGKFGIGALGKARTGLNEGQIDVQVNEGRTCPAT